MCAYIINILVDHLNYSIQSHLIIKQTLMVSSLKMCRRVTNSVKMKGSEGATYIPCFQWNQRVSLWPAVVTQEGPCSCSSPCPKPLIPFSPGRMFPKWPNSYPFKNSCHRVWTPSSSTISSCRYLFLGSSRVYAIAPNVDPSIKMTLRCQVSHWPDPSI